MLVEVALTQDHSVNYFLQTINIIIFAINPLVMIHKEVLWWRTDPILWWLGQTMIPLSMGTPLDQNHGFRIWAKLAERTTVSWSYANISLSTII